MSLPGFQPTPLSQIDFDALRQDKDWRLRPVYLDTFEASYDSLANKGGVGGGDVHFVVRRTGRSDYPYLLYGPLSGEAAKSPWPTKEDVESYFRQVGEILSHDDRSNATDA
jgi:hypothetical protein